MDITSVFQSLSLEERCKLLVGFDSWHTWSFPEKHVPALMMADGPHGLRKQLESGNSIAVNQSYQAVCYPPAVSLAASFDVDIVRSVGSAIGKECQGEGVHVILGPGLNIKRSPLCGRNFEYYSEDPVVSGTLAKAFVEGVQNEGVGACLKHFALNSQETHRMTSSSVADPRAVRELYTRAFEIALEAKPKMVMCSYNKIDGVYAAENKALLKDLLRKTFGFEGVIVSDWTAVSDRVKSVLATLDLEMPGHLYSVTRLVEAAKQSRDVQTEINHSALRVLTLTLESNQTATGIKADLEAHHALAGKIAEECVVLLKNEGNLLPLNKKADVCLIGELARTVRYQGGGSSHVNPTKIETLADHLRGVNFAPGYRLDGDGYDESKIKEAVIYATRADVAVVVVGLTDIYESEGYDRTHLNLPKGHDELVAAVAKVNKNTIVILQIGSPVLMPWLADVKAVINGYLGGEAGHTALHHVLYGLKNPSGRLAETFPKALEEVSSTPFFAKGNHEVHYQESLYVGYRYQTSAKIKALFPFGYGLSYTTFETTNLRVDHSVVTVPFTLSVTLDVTNTGTLDGKETVLLFVGNPRDDIPRPVTELKRFVKVALRAGETKPVAFVLTEADFARFHPQENCFIADSGDYQIEIRANAETLLTALPVTIIQPRIPSLGASIHRVTSYLPPSLTFETKDFETHLNHPLGHVNLVKTRPFTIDATLEDVSSHWLGRLIRNQVVAMAKKQIASEDPAYVEMVGRSILETPLRSIVIFSGGKISFNLMFASLEIINRHPWQAFKRLWKRG
jgi:beta-glucosidase